MSDAAEVIAGRRAWAVVQGDALGVLRTLPADTFHVCCTSPPYYALRDYKCSGQIGLEKTPEEFVARLVEVFREVRRVLRHDGQFWCNIGDSYCSSPAGNAPDRPSGFSQNSPKRLGNVDHVNSHAKATGFPPGSLFGMPWRLAEALRADGWHLRSELLWVKLSSMPESVCGWRWEKCRVKTRRGHTAGFGRNNNDGGEWDKDSHPATRIQPDWRPCPGCKKCEPNGGLVLRKGSWRPTRAHEYLFQFTKSPTYYGDPEPVRTRLADATISRDRYSRVLDDPDEQFAVKHDHETPSNPAGANPRSWQVFPVEPLKEKHYAAFPSALPAFCIAASVSAHGCCVACGAPWARVIERTVNGTGVVCPKDAAAFEERFRGVDGLDTSGLHSQYLDVKRNTLGWRATCSCGTAEISPPLVLDPFAGSGTTLMAARRLNCRAVGIELSEEYARMSRRRVGGVAPLFDGA